MGRICAIVILSYAIVVHCQPPTRLALGGVVPPNFVGQTLVDSNFFGISIESSHLNSYVGEGTSSIPPTIVNYLSNIRTRSPLPLRIRIGGNSMDDTTYDPNQANMITLTGINNTANKQPAILGPAYFDTLKAVSDEIGGAQYLIGLGLINPSNPNVTTMVSAVEQKLDDTLDALLLGNEPDLYGPHGDRAPGYSIENYFWDFNNVTQLLKTSPYGDLLAKQELGGPTICCNWDLIDLIDAGYLQQFGEEIKYINLQHYPQNNCGESYRYQIDYYLQHSNVVELAKWQLPGILAARNASKQVTMGEFNTASCGGIPGISDTFSATLWTVDYVLQMATIGYSAAYIHTRESGITYNLFDPPVNGSDWTTLPAYYSLLPVAEALGGNGGSYVLDLNINNSTLANSTTAGYGVYNGTTGQINNIVLFNFADQGSAAAKIAIPAQGEGSTSGENGTTQVLARYLVASSVHEKTNISWGGKTLAGRTDGKFVDSGTSPDVEMDCTSGCTIDIPSPGMTVVWMNSADGNHQSTDEPKANRAERLVSNLMKIEASFMGSILLVLLHFL